MLAFPLLAACTESLPYGGRFSGPPRVTEATPEGRMVWPVRGAIASPYRPPSRPGHQGIDFASPPGSLVVSALPGRVSFVGRIPGYGNVVAMEHGDHLTTVYSHLADEPQATEGTRLTAGEVIGRVGSEGYLHYEIRRAKEAVDPAQFYSAPPAPAGATSGTTAAAVEPEAAVPLGEEPSPLEGAALPPQTATSPPAVAASEPAPEVEPAPAFEAAPIEAPEPPAGEAAAGGVIGGGAVAGDDTAADASEEPAAAEESAVAAEPAREDFAEGDEVVARATEPEPAAPRTEEGILGREPEPARDEGLDGSMIAGLAVSNLFWVPAKLAYAGAGGVVGGFAFVLSGGAVTEVWDEAFGGDYYLTGAHLRGEVPMRFRGGS